jgi:hypothetical protein
MTSDKELKQKLKQEIDEMDEKELERIEGDQSRIKRWAKKVLSAAWSAIKSAVGSFISSLFL